MELLDPTHRGLHRSLEFLSFIKIIKTRFILMFLSFIKIIKRLSFNLSKNAIEMLLNFLVCINLLMAKPCKIRRERLTQISPTLLQNTKCIFRFLPRHTDEIEIEIGDPVYVQVHHTLYIVILHVGQLFDQFSSVTKFSCHFLHALISGSSPAFSSS